MPACLPTLQAIELIKLQLHFSSGAPHARPLAVVEGLTLIFGQKLRSPSALERVESMLRAAAPLVAPLASPLGSASSLLWTEGVGVVAGLALLPEHGALFAALDVGEATGKPLLVCGPDLSGKASAVLRWAAGRGLRCESHVLTPDATAEDLFGKWVPNANDGQRPGGLLSASGDHGEVAPPFRWEPGPVMRAMREGSVLLLRGIDAPQPAVLESLNALLELRPSPGAACSALVLGRLVEAREGFRVVCTSRGSQHDLTPALASRFLAVTWGGEERVGCKLTAAAGLDALVACYTQALGTAEGGEARAAIFTALREAFGEAGR